MPTKKRITLFFPQTGWDTEGVTAALPLPLLCLAGPLVEAGYDVRILDQRLDRDWREELRRDARSGEMLALGVTAMTGKQILGGLEASRIVKEARSRVPVIWGGVHPTLLPEQTLENEFIDAVVIGEGEEALVAIARAIESEGAFEEIPGVACKRDGEIHRQRALPSTVDLDRQPRWPYHLVDMRRYITTKVLGERDFIFSASRGCPHACTYCFETAQNINSRWRSMSPERVVDELIYLRDTYDITAINFQDDLFFGKKRWVSAVCDEMIHRRIGMSFRADCRVDYALGYGVEYLRHCHQAGFKMLFVGVESGSDRILKFIRKAINREKVLASAEVFRESGVMPHCSFMGGYPTETMEEIHETLDLMARIPRICPGARTTNLQIFTPYPGTELFDHCTAAGMKVPARLEEWAESNWNTSNQFWLSRRQRRFLERASYFSYFIDGQTIVDWYSSRPLMRTAARLYSKIVGARVRRRFYHFMPEMDLVGALKNRGMI